MNNKIKKELDKFRKFKKNMTLNIKVLQKMKTEIYFLKRLMRYNDENRM